MNTRRASLAVVVLCAVSIFFSSHVARADETPGVFIHVRYHGVLAFEGTTTLPEATTTTLKDSSGTLHNISSDSALYLLSLASASSSAFSLSDLQYYSSFNEFFVNCIDITTTTPIHACANWQYAVNGNTPGVGSDQYIASNNDNIYFYFGSPRQFFVSATTTDTATPVKVTAQKYDYTTDSLLPLAGEVVGATQPDPSNPYSPLVIASSTSAGDGTVSLLLTNAGPYNIGLQSDYYYPTIAVVVSTSTSQQTTDDQNNNGNGGGGGSQTQSPTFNTDSAAQFLASKQNSDGSFGSSLYTDWAAIGLGGYSGQDSMKSKLRSYLSANTDSGSLATDAERHVMALMALGINPYSGTSVDYIKKITDQFDGTQIGDSNLYNDDIFALFPLLKAGYTTNDSLIQKEVQFIVSRQSPDGSWGSVDMTAAAIQALSQVQSIVGVSDSINRATNFLKNSEVNGGFGNSPATSWALQAIATLGQSPSSWQQGNVNPLSYLASLQQSDGGVEPVSTDPNARVWATSYAIPAALGKPWQNFLSSFPKPVQATQTQLANGGSSFTAATTSTQIKTAATSITPILPVPIQVIKPIVQNPAVTAQPKPKQTTLKIQSKIKTLSEISTSTASSTTKAETNNQAAAVAQSTTTENPWLAIIGVSAVILGLAGFHARKFFKGSKI